MTHPANPSLFPLMGRPVAYLLSTADTKMTQKSFNFARKFSLPLYFVSAADGTNVVKVTISCREAWEVRQPGGEGAREVSQRRAGCRVERAGTGLGVGLRQAGVPVGTDGELMGPWTMCGVGVMGRR